MKVRGRPARSIAVLLTLAMLMTGLGIVPAFGAAGSFEGGAVDAPQYVMNDHTVLGIRINATSGLQPNSTYYLKMRFTAEVTPSSATNRGFTWNWQTNEWVQEREDWTSFPTVTTDASGLLSNKWVYVKFGDEQISGDYYLMTSLSLTGAGTTYNSATLPQVHVIDAATEGAWVHNGNDNSGKAGKRCEITAVEDTTTVYTLREAELNLADDDANGVVDDEDFGPVGVPGDYRMGTAAGMTFDLLVNRVVVASSVAALVADTDITMLAGDGVAPSTPANVEATVGSGEVTLDWDAATDAGSGVDHYNIYRWMDDPLTTLPYTQVKELIGTSDSTTYTDTGLENGLEYSYLVRAVDADDNVSARSDTVLATPAGEGDTDRLFGDTRYTTAIDISANTFPESSVTTAVIATGKNFPDALAASGLAGVYDSPVLLVGDSVTASLTAELDRIGATGVVLIGETPAVSADVAAEFAEDYSVQRIGGANRYETAAMVAEEIAALTGSVDSAFIVRGDTYPDALATAPFAFSQQWPVLLVRTDGVPAETSQVISDLGIDNGFVAGSEYAVSATTYDALDGMLSGLLERVWGLNRYETAAEIAEYGAEVGWGDFSYVGMATGLNFPDALGGGVAAGHNGGVLLLTPTTSLHEAAAASITDHQAEIDLVELYGSTVALSDAVRDAIDAILNP